MTDAGITFRAYKSEQDLLDSIHLIEADLSEPYTIYTYRYFLHTWPRLSFLALAPPDAAGVAQSIGVIISKCDFSKRGRKRGYIAMLAVDPAYRKRGVATELVRRACAAIARQAGTEVVLETEVENETSLAFYASLGFIRDKRLAKYYLSGEDAFRLKLLLKNAPDIIE